MRELSLCRVFSDNALEVNLSLCSNGVCIRHFWLCSSLVLGKVSLFCFLHHLWVWVPLELERPFSVALLCEWQLLLTVRASTGALSTVPLRLWLQVVRGLSCPRVLHNNESQTVANSLIIQRGLKKKPRKCSKAAWGKTPVYTHFKRDLLWGFREILLSAGQCYVSG